MWGSWSGLRDGDGIFGETVRVNWEREKGAGICQRPRLNRSVETKHTAEPQTG